MFPQLTGSRFLSHMAARSRVVTSRGGCAPLGRGEDWTGKGFGFVEGLAVF
jgi:hypothetical protein